MTLLRYFPGDFTLFVSDDVACLIESEIDQSLLDSIWATLRGDDEVTSGDVIDDLLEVLTGSFGIRRLPRFALLARVGTTRTVVRRGVRVVLAGSELENTASAANAPWQHSVAEPADCLEVGVGVEVGVTPFPLGRGVVKASGFRSEPPTPIDARILKAADQALAETALEVLAETAHEPEPTPAVVVGVGVGVASDVEPEPQSVPGSESSNDTERGYTTLFQRHRAAPGMPPESATSTTIPDVPVAPIPAAAAATREAAASSTQKWDYGDTSSDHPEAAASADPAVSSTPASPAQLPPPPAWRPGASGQLIDGIPDFGMPSSQTKAAPGTRPPPSSAPSSGASAPSPAAPLLTSTQAQDSWSQQHEQAATLPRPQVDLSVARLGTDVLAARCPQGHLSPPHAATCRVCSASLPQQDPILVTRPSLGQLRLPGNETIAVDRGVIFGRSPHEPSGIRERPHLINVSSYGPHLSRMHLEVVIDGWFVMARDLGSTEGTFLTMPGHPTERLRANVLVSLETGSVLDLAGDYKVMFEVQ